MFTHFVSNQSNKTNNFVWKENAKMEMKSKSETWKHQEK